MKTQITNISATKLAFLFATAGLTLSLLGLLFLYTTPIKEGVTVTLSGFASFTFKDAIETRLVILYPLVNIVYGAIAGFILAVIYNIWSRCSGGITINLVQTEETKNV